MRPSRAGGLRQGLADIYKVRDVVSGTHMEYHRITIPRGKEVVLADLTGPGKVTYWYITDDTDGKLYPGLVLKVFWDDEPARASTCRWPTSSGPWAATPSTTSRRP